MGTHMIPHGPFVLLDDARPGGAQRLYRDPIAVVEGSAFAELRTGRTEGRHAAGYWSYDGSGWFGIFATVQPFDIASLPDSAGAFCSAPEPLIEYDAYAQMLDRASRDRRLSG